MRLDKFLKVSRLIKRRTVAKEASDQGRIWINGRASKASSLVNIGDELIVQYGHKKVVVRVERLMEASRKDEAAGMYTIIREEHTKELPDEE